VIEFSSKFSLAGARVDLTKQFGAARSHHANNTTKRTERRPDALPKPGRLSGMELDGQRRGTAAQVKHVAQAQELLKGVTNDCLQARRVYSDGRLDWRPPAADLLYMAFWSHRC
jgi:hypothetical protein